jgi:hypothetical protein
MLQTWGGALVCHGNHSITAQCSAPFLSPAPVLNPIPGSSVTPHHHHQRTQLCPLAPHILRAGGKNMFPKCFHTPVPEVPPEIIGQCFLHPFLIAAYHNDILWKINTYPPSHRFFRPEEEEDDDVKLSLNGLVYSGVISFISFQLVIYGLNFLHPGAWLAFLWRIIKKNLDVQAFNHWARGSQGVSGRERRKNERSKHHCSHHQNPKIKSIISLKYIKVLFLSFGMGQPIIPHWIP